MTILFAVICFEGLGRTFLVDIPSAVFFLAKDVVLISAVFFIGVDGKVVGLARSLYGRFLLFLPLTMAWTVLEMFNPEHTSMPLALWGLRSYWLWWAAPILIATALRGAEQRRRAALVLAVYSILVALYATAQFASPPDAPINSYALYQGETVQRTALMHATGRARIAGTFSFIAGFADFATIAPIILLGVGLDSRLRTRMTIIVAAILIASTVAMSGSRSGLILCSLGLLVLLLRSGFIRSRTGWWTLTAIGVAAFFSFYRSQDAVDGMVNRFEGGDTGDRIENELRILPPVALARTQYELFGIGTGMLQNARFQFGSPTEYALEEEPPRLLGELGPIGYLLFWIARLGIMVALWRASQILKRGGQRGAAGGAAALCVLTMFNRIVFDHVWQALFFIALGMVLSATLDVVQKPKTRTVPDIA